MAGSTNDTSSIDPQNSGFPPYLDFDQMRTNVITYLGPITGNYWTDYNVHDPGITTLEVLIYAIMDLGYRTHLPFGSLLAGPAGPNGATLAAPTFFTAGQSFGDNPLTILDYRKLLMDLAEVRNAWLKPEPAPTPYNGLYHVDLELAKDAADFPDIPAWKAYMAEVSKEVRHRLRTHRNLCEDVQDVKVLEKQFIGVKADLEVAPGTDIAAAYQGMVAALYTFFSPVPTYYTLGQLTAKQVSPDTIFRGRPYSKGPSHGFLLDQEMPAGPGTDRHIRLSDVYQAILAVSGLQTVRSLQLLDQKGRQLKLEDKEWMTSIPSGNIPAFLLSVSSFRWFANNQLLTTDVSAYNASLERSGRYSNKILYPAGPPALDAVAPPAVTLPGLADYRSIQNDYPLVYGIGPGGLPPDVSTQRQSQALQFKAFLLFFDQLFADYVAQLANLKQIFSMSAPAGGSTYFHGDLTSVPGLAGLLRFPPAAAGAAGGTILVIPVAVQAWEQLLNDACSPNSGQSPSSTGNESTNPRYPPGATPARKATGSIPGLFHPPGHGAATIRVTTLPGPGQISSVRAAAFQPYNLPTAIARDTALATTAVLFGGDPPAVETLLQDDNRWRYYFNKINPDYILLSRNSFSTQADAQGEAATVLYIGQNVANYSRTSLGEKSQYSFSVASSTQSYYDYLQDILEDKQQFTERRTLFLTHLLARFGEAFTDYAFLEAGFGSAGQIATGQIDGIQNFLTRWPILSGDRGRAVDYGRERFPGPPASGLEQRVYAYCGIPDTRNSIYCHFEVYRGEEWFRLDINVKEETLFSCPGGFSGKQALPAVKGLLRTLADRSAYRVVVDEQTGDYGLEVTLYGQYIARSTSRWLDAPAAERAADAGFRLFQREPSKDDIVATGFECRPRLFNSAEQVVRVGRQGYAVAEEAEEAGYFLLTDIDKKKFWDQVDPAPLKKLRRNQYPGLPAGQVMAEGSFDISAHQDVLGEGKEDRWSFELLDRGHRFRFRSTGDYETKAAADEAGYQLLHFLAEAKYYTLRRVRGEIRVVIRVDDTDWAEGEPRWEDERSAGEWMTSIVRQVRRHRYYIRVECQPVRWRWLFFFGLPGQELLRFKSLDEYASPETAADAAHEFYRRGPHWELQDTGRGLELAGTLETEDADPARAARLLAFREAAWALSAGGEQAQRHCLIPIEPTLKGAWLYRLVDKEHPRAFHPFERFSRQEAEELRDQLIRRGCEGYRFLEICLGGDNVRFDPPADYRYLLRCRNDYFRRLGVTGPDRELVLFESGKHYLTEAAAQDDFQKNYFKLLDLAGDPGNYGEGRPIRLAGVEGGDHPPLLIVPAATRDALVGAGLMVVDTLVEAVWTYPFCEEKDRYRFVLGSDWKSAPDFPSPGEAQEAFNDFLLLLDYPGNYFIDIDWTVCAYRVGIREVLLESYTRFPDEADAWGKEGVERCIGVAQTKGGFHLSQRADCSYTYCVACPNPLAAHPCTYDNAARRDEVLAQLRQHPGYFLPDGWLGERAHHRFKLRDGRGHPVAWVPIPAPDTQNAIINRILDIIAAIDHGARPQPFGDSWQLIVGEGAHAFAIEEVEEEPASTWMRKLNEVADYFPVTRNTPLPGHYEPATYLLVIKLPGFSDPVIPPSALRDCGCPPDPGAHNRCYAAWIGRTAFTMASDTWNTWLELLPVLAEGRNYHPVFGEEIGQYGIELREPDSLVACNPQHYPYGAAAIGAMQRAKARINAEGLHLVEHLLLRSEEAIAAIPVCADQDPCASVLGSPAPDPYSFILTVTLPAWPARFRTPANRALLESMIQRETPAHILPRILWLTPRDMCRMETLYGGWIDHLQRQAEGFHSCRLFDVEAFIRFLFEAGSAGPILGSPCDPAGAPARDPDPDQNAAWLREINELYCWGSPPATLHPKDVVKIRVLERTRGQRYSENIKAWKKATGADELANKIERFQSNPEPPARVLEELLTAINEAEEKETGIHAARPRPPRLAATVLAIFLDRIVRNRGERETWAQMAAVLGRCGHRVGEADNFYNDWQPEELLPLAPRLDLPHLRKVLKENIHHRP